MSLDVGVRRDWKGFSLDMAFRSPGGILGILGASGCGKSMTLGCIAGTVTPTAGRVVLNDRVLFDGDRNLNTRPQLRRIGCLFQSYALFPHMTVEENIGCGLGKMPKSDRGRRVNGMLARFQLDDLGGRYPGQLSGGQQQRVALARMLIGEPDALLLDEPFSALDTHLKEQLQLELLDLLQGYAGDVIIVSHSRDEIYRLCERLVVMADGRCVASGNTRELFAKPGSPTVARLTGCKNISPAVPWGQRKIYAEDWGVRLAVSAPVPDGLACVGVRAHSWRPAQSADAPNAFPVRVVQRLEGPFEWNLLLALGEGESAGKIWWTVAKESGSIAIPAYLSVAPEDVLLLRGT